MFCNTFAALDSSFYAVMLWEEKKLFPIKLSSWKAIELQIEDRNIFSCCCLSWFCVGGFEGWGVGMEVEIGKKGGKVL